MHPIYSSILTEVRVNPKYIMNSSQHQATPMINIGILYSEDWQEYSTCSARKPKYAHKSTYIQPCMHICAQKSTYTDSNAHCMYAHMCTKAHIYRHACTNAQLHTSMSPRTHKRTLWHKECSRLTDLGQ